MGRSKKNNSKLAMDLQQVDENLVTQSQDSAATDRDVYCQSCTKELPECKKALYVEEEVGRVFCSEECILAQFQPEITQLEAEYYDRVSEQELSTEEREELLPLRWSVLKNPDEIWRDQAPEGDYRYRLISEFDHDGQPLWVVCITLFLRGDPSFLFLAAVTNDPEMIAHYRTGERIHWNTPSKKDVQVELAQFYDQDESAEVIDGLAAEGWSEEDSLRAELRSEEGLIEESDHEDEVVETTLESPDEVWIVQSTEVQETPRFYHFIKRMEAEKVSETDECWSVIVAQEGENIDEIEIIECFTTKSSELVEKFRQGTQELSSSGEVQSSSRFVH